MMTMIHAAPRPEASDIYYDWMRGAPILAGAALMFGMLAIPTMMAMAVDDRVLLGVNIWAKPLKFEISIAVYLATIAWAAQYLPESWRRARWRRWYEAAIVFTLIAEMMWIGGASSVGTTSHFNYGDPMMSAIYGLMGLFAIFGLSGAFTYGLGVLRAGHELGGALRRAVGWSLMASFVLTVIFGSYMASQTGHGVDLAGDGKMAITGWAREGGDLRVAHFFAMHAMHFVPAFALLMLWLAPHRAWAATRAFLVLFCAFTLWTFVEAVIGRAFLGALL